MTTANLNNQPSVNNSSVALAEQQKLSEMSNVFSYEGNNVTMRLENGVVFVNLTEVAKAFPSKNLTQIINSKEIQEYATKLATKLQIYSLADLLIVTRGGDGSHGTWAHQRVALRVAQKLSTDFAIWVDEKIEELLTTGRTSITKRIPTQKPKPSDLPIEDQIKLMTMVCKEVNATKAEKRNAFNNLLAQNGLPQITASERTEAKTGKEAQSATDLLTFHKIGIGARKFFDMLEEHGYTVKNTRSTTRTRSGKSNYSVLTEKGLKWGYNDPNRYAGNKYDVYFYTDKFPELLKELGLK